MPTRPGAARGGDRAGAGHAGARRRGDRGGLRRASSTSCAASRPTRTSSSSISSGASASATGLTGLKLGYNRVQGFFIEVSRRDAERVPRDYIRRQTVKSAERFITAELKSFEDRVLGARDTALARERELYEAVLTQLVEALGAAAAQRRRPRRARCAGRAGRARRRARVELRLTLVSRAAPDDRGRPPPGGRALRERPSCPMTCRLDARAAHAHHHRPQHGRQIHLHAPGRADRAARAHRQLRAGRARRARPARSHLHAHRRCRRPGRRPLDLHGGDDARRPTSCTTPPRRSLILLDEIGRGTSTFDGLSLAWAVARDIATRVRAFTLFATHYFELTTLPREVEGCANVHLDATEHGDGHRVPARREGRARQSQLRPAGGAARRCAAAGDRRGPALSRGSSRPSATEQRAAGDGEAAAAAVASCARSSPRPPRSPSPRRMRCAPRSTYRPRRADAARRSRSALPPAAPARGPLSAAPMRGAC